MGNKTFLIDNRHPTSIGKTGVLQNNLQESLASSAFRVPNQRYTMRDSVTCPTPIDMLENLLIVIVISATMALAIKAYILPGVVNGLLKFGLGNSGEFADWHMTIEHNPMVTPTAHDCWNTAIAYIDDQGGELIRRWNSHASTGDRLNREYLLEHGKILLELDRWNGFTISGKKEVARQLAETIFALAENEKDQRA